MFARSRSNVSFYEERNQGHIALVVDDSPEDLFLARRVLHMSEQIDRVVCLPSAEKLFEELKFLGVYSLPEQRVPKIVIFLDICMPAVNGISILQQLKSTHYTADVPVIMLTGAANSENVDRTYRMEAKGFIAKPFTGMHLDFIHRIFSAEDQPNS